MEGPTQQQKKRKDPEPEQLPAHLFPDTDWNESYYRVGFRDYQISDAKSALQKEIRRGNGTEARFWAAVLLGSHKIENLINRLVVIASEDISIADNRLVGLAKSVQDLYMEKRKAKDKSGVRGAWKELRNDLELRCKIFQLIGELSLAPKSRITDHALSLHCHPMAKKEDAAIYRVLPHGINARSKLEVPGFGALLDRVVAAPAYSEDLERLLFEEMRKVLRPCETWAELENKRPAINFQKKKLEAAFAQLTNGNRVERLCQAFMLSMPRVMILLRNLRDMALHRAKFASESHVPRGLPGKVQLAHSILIYTRACLLVDLKLATAPVPFEEDLPDLREESRARFAGLITGSEDRAPPAYALDRHTRGGAGGVDRSLEGFFQRELEALTPVAAVPDPYKEECLDMARQRDHSAKKARVSSDEDEGDGDE